jgi:hypothetical protein
MPTSSIMTSILEGQRGLGNSGLSCEEQEVNIWYGVDIKGRRTSEIVSVRMLCSEEPLESLHERD